MTDLRACYFCGTAEAAEAGPAIPPAFDPPAAAQQSVVLCPTCREKLTAVLEPVFEGGTVPAADGASGAAPDAEDAGSGGPDPSDRAGFGVVDAPDGGADAGSDRADDPGSDSTDDEDDPPVDRIPESGVDPADREDDGDGDGAGGEAATEPPDQYYTVLRFLENREFPLGRDGIADVVADVYDLSREEVEGILDAAIDRGVLVEADGRLARSRDRL